MTRRRKRILWRLGVLLALYGVFVMFGGCADRAILFPRTGWEDANGAERRTISGPAGTLEILMARSPAAATRPVVAMVLAFGGNASRAEWVATPQALQWAAHPVEVWAMNYPGYGASAGKAKLASLPPAALAAYDHLAAQAPGRPIIVAGESLGTTLALYVATQRPVAGVVLHNPPPLQNMILARYGWWNLWLLAGPVAMGVPSEMNSLRNAPRVNVPAVFMLSDADEVVPPRFQQRVVEAYAGPRQTIRSAGGHNSVIGGTEQRELRRQLNWLWEQAKLP